MCGFAGILYKLNREVDIGMLRQMEKSLVHRGPDAGSSYISKCGRLGFVHRRLSIIDVSSVSNQPFLSADGNSVCVYNGEVYNFKEVQSNMLGFAWRTCSDTEVITETLNRFGTKAINSWKGMFALAHWNENEESLLLVRDRFGVKPLYYFQGSDFFIFGSEVRSLLASGLIPGEINIRSVSNYLQYGSVQEPDSLVSGIKQLPAGHLLRVSSGKINIERYWSTVENISKVIPDSRIEASKQIRKLLKNAVSTRLVSDVPVGAFLSGGIDSSAVVALMAESSTSPIDTFNVSFNEVSFDESAYAKLVASRFNTRHHEIVLPPGMLIEQLEDALQAMDSPSGDGINTYVVSRAVRRQGIKVALSGIGGDELFGGYPIFNNYFRITASKWLLNASYPIRKILGEAGKSIFSGRRQRAFGLMAERNLDILSLYPHFRSLHNTKDNEALLRNQYAINNAKVDIFESEQNLSVYTQVSIAELENYTRNTLLKDADQMSMSISLEVREPFFDHELVSFVLALPDSYKRGFFIKSLLVEALSDLLPTEVYDRPKQGFLLPWEKWIRNELRLFCEKRIEAFSNRPFADKINVLRIWNRFVDGDRSVRWIYIWQIVVLEYWLEKNHVH